jgi:hypothetical protein
MGAILFSEGELVALVESFRSLWVSVHFNPVERFRSP